MKYTKKQMAFKYHISDILMSFVLGLNSYDSKSMNNVDKITRVSTIFK